MRASLPIVIPAETAAPNAAAGAELPSTVLVKPAGPDCNLSCAYCFYRDKGALFPAGPHRMEDETLERLIQQHLSRSAREVTFCWQGGEPTLLGREFFERVVALQARHGRGHRVANALQTNATRLDPRWAAFLEKYRFLVGVSLDGDERTHDAHRRAPTGEGTWAKVVENTRMLLDAGVATNALAVVTEASAAQGPALYEVLQALGLRHLQFIPLVASTLPASRRERAAAVRPATYGSFLCACFDRWLGDLGSVRQTSVRTFDALLERYLGRTPPECTLHARCESYLVVEHDGSVYPCDFFVDPRWRLGDLATASLGELWRSPRRRAFSELKAALPEACAACEWRSLCRGGCPKDRLLGEAARTNALCEAYRTFFRHAHAPLTALAARLRAERAQASGSARADGGGPGAAAPAGAVGRNDPCPCGSGRKHKKCCGGR